MMNKLSEELDKVLDSIRQKRDELKVKIHLGRADALDEWEKVEEKWSQLKRKAKNIRSEMSDSTKDLESSVRIVAEEIKNAYDRIRERL